MWVSSSCLIVGDRDESTNKWGFGIVQPARINQQFRVVNAYMLDYKQCFFLRCPSNSQSPALCKGYLVGGIGIDHHRPIRLKPGGFLPPGCFDHRGDHGRAQRRGEWCGDAVKHLVRDNPLRKRTWGPPWNFRTWNGDLGPEMELKKAYYIVYQLDDGESSPTCINLSLTNLWVFKNYAQLGQKTSGFCHAFQGESSELFQLGWLGPLG